MKSLKYKIQKFIVTSPIGNLQFFKRPLCLIFGGSTAYKIKGEQQREILKKLRPGDILLRRYDRYLLSQMLPGYWSHVGIYVGKNIVIHSVTKPGVVEEDILTFLRCDSIAIYRPQIDKYKKQTAMDRARSLLGKEYDFAMDFSDEEFFSCSETIQFCFKDLDDSIKIEKRETGFLTKGTIPPDDLQYAGFKKILEIKGK